MREVWTQTLEALRSELPQHTYNTWLKPLQYQSATENEVRVEVPNVFYRDRLQQDYAELLRKRLRQLSQQESLDVSFVVSQKTDESVSLLRDISRAKKEFNRQEKAAVAIEGLNPRYTFESFVVGSSTEFAHAATRAVAQTPGRTYNPLFIYGGVGLGKTHLLCAIGNMVASEQTARKIVFRTAEQFTNELIAAIRYEKTTEFRARYRKACDILLIDDVQFIGGKERTQEEFFHTFNALYEDNKQIVLTSDQTPDEIPDLDDRLRSRFQLGLLCDIQPPDVETRVAILTKKAEAQGVFLPDDVALFLATHIKSNIRVLEGALVRLAAFASISRREITLELTREVFQSLGTEDSSITMELIQKRVAEFFNLNLSDIRSPRRHRMIAQPRQIAMYLCRKLTPASFPEIGHRFGGKDHTTVMHGVSKIERLLYEDPRLRQTVATIEQNLTT